MNAIRWGLLSTANINRRLIPSIRSSPRGKLVAVSSRDIDIAGKYAAEWGIPLAFGSYQAMLDSDQIDAVYIGLPNHMHAEWTIKALACGKHVLCEKPLALTLQEVDQMIAASHKYQCYLAEALMYRHHPQTKIVGEWVHSGRLGDITLVQSDFHFQLTNRKDVRLVPEYGGGCLWDIGIYPISFAQFIYGKAPESVFGFNLQGETGVDETFTGMMTYTKGQFSLISSSFRNPFHTRAEIIGTSGRLELTRPFNSMDENQKLIFYPKVGVPEMIHVPEEELYSGEVEDLHSVVLDGKTPYLTLGESRDHVATLLALYESASKDSPVQPIA